MAAVFGLDHRDGARNISSASLAGRLKPNLSHGTGSGAHRETDLRATGPHIPREGPSPRTSSAGNLNGADPANPAASVSTGVVAHERTNQSDLEQKKGTMSTAKTESRDLPRRNGSPSTSSPSSLHQQQQHEDWRMSNAQSSHSVHSLKRRHGERSPSRPRSQQGPPEVQIAAVKDAERENEERRAAEAANHGPADRDADRSFGSRGYGGGDYDSPRKTPRLDTTTNTHSRSGPASEWEGAGRRTMAAEEASRNHRSAYARGTSPDGASHMAGRRRAGTMGSADGGDRDPNYTWHHRDAAPALPHEGGQGGYDQDRSGAAAQGDERYARLPPLMTGYRSNEPAPTSAPPAPRRGEGKPSPSSSTPQLPGFSALSPYPTAGHRRGSSPDPSQAMHRGGGGSHHGRMGLPARVPSYGGEGHPHAMSAHSPSLSHASHSAPGQPFIHPSLAGLPGAGGAAGSRQQPSFVSKLYSMLEDETIEEMIAWGPSGTTFSVANPAEFAKAVLPNWFKHSNWQSFVRQLNMYGFHKVNHTYQGTPEEEVQVWEFKHPSFRRGEVQLLNDIKRKSSRHKRQDSLSRAMPNVGEYDMGTPSPDMGMMSHGGHMGEGHGPPVYGGLPASRHPMAGPPPGSGASGMHPAQSSSYGGRGPMSASAPAGGAYLDYHEAAVGGGGGPAPGPPHPSVVHAPPPHTGPPGVPPPSVGHGGERVPASMAVEGVVVRMDDLSDRIDAIIRHASYLEGQLRTVSDQLFHAQQNEASLRTHVHHLEAQMRTLSDQLYQQRGLTPTQAGNTSNVPPPSANTRGFSPSAGYGPGGPAAGSPSSSLTRSRHNTGASPPPASMLAASREGGRFQAPYPPRETGSGEARSAMGGGGGGQGPSQNMPAYVSRSPQMSSAMSYGPGGRGGMAKGGAGGGGGSGRSTPASSADAYARYNPGGAGH